MKAPTLWMLCGLSLAMAGAAVAEPAGAPRDTGFDALPPNRIIAIVRATGFDPMGNPTRNGDVYVLRALDPNDIAYRLVIDARTGRTVSMRQIAMPGPYEVVPASARNRGPYSWIFGPGDAGGVGAPRPPRAVPQAAPHQDTATPLPRPRPYEMEATGSLPTDSSKAPGPSAPSVPQTVPASEPPKGNGGASMPPIAPLD
ncbi:MAG TPA: hypothetical protein VLX44_07425 [Xanthobacteraceae bacterium]|nr:hypothetical protein [Xanthobacteraceae bacterium]